jgi:hypothetical protein
MRAYLLDPLSPYVIAAEKTVLPAWETMRGQNSRLGNDRAGVTVHELNNMSNIGTANMTPQNSNSLGSSFNPRPSQPATSAQSADEQMRIETLKLQKEQERLEKERTVWREASQAPRIFGEDDPVNLSSQQQQPQEPPKHQSTGLFSRLRLGKFLE